MSGYHEPTTVAPNLVRVGGDGGGSILRLPILPGYDLPGALGGETPGPSDGGATPAPDPEDPDDVAAAAADPADTGTLPATGSRPPWPVAVVLGLAAIVVLRLRSASP